MSVNAGGLFFCNNPTSLPTQPQDGNNGEQDETQMNATTANYQQQQQQVANNNNSNLQQNLALLQQQQLNQQQQGNNNVLMSNNEIDVAITSLFQNNNNDNHSQAIGCQLNNNNTGLVQNVPQGIVQNVQPQGIVQNTGGFSSFFFNPLAFLTNNITTTQNQVQQQQAAQLQQAVQLQAANQLLNNQNNLGAVVNNNNNVMNTNLGISSVNYQQQQQGQNLGDFGNANNILLLNNNNNDTASTLLGGVYQQNGTIQMNNILQQQQQPLPSASPVPMAFLTPNQGPTPCPTPPPKSPLFHDANEFSLDNNNRVQAPQTLQVTPSPPQCDTSPPPFPSKSLFQRGVSSMGSALGAVATYVNQSLLSGIPFHVADRAMKESKETYAKWWEDGINVHSSENKKKRKDMEDNGEDGDDNDLAAGKKRKLDAGGAALGTGCTGSALSNLLKKHYDDMGIDTSSNFVEYEQQLYTQSQQLPLTLPTVDSSIINPRRSQFEHKEGLPTPAQQTHADSTSGYDAFNNIGGMYDFGNGENEVDSGIAQGGIGDTYHSLYSYCTTNEVNDNDVGTTSLESAAATTAHSAQSIQQQSTLDDTMEAIQQLLEEKNRASEENELLQMMSAPRDWVKKSIRSELIGSLQSVHGDVTDNRFLSSLDILSNFYITSGRDARVSPWSGRRSRTDPSIEGGEYGYSGSEVGGPKSSDLLEGHWVNMSRPNYIECLGKNEENEFMYTLGRMSFDMFMPSDLVCSVQSTHNTIKIVGEKEELPALVPKSLREEVATLSDSSGSEGKRPLLRSYDIAVSLTIEPPESVGQPETPTTPTPSKRMRAIMSVKGYILPDPKIPNRLTVWFTGGKLSPARLPSNGDETDEEDQAESAHKTESDGYGGFEEWKAIFAKGKWRKTLGERARAMAAKLLLGADVPSKMEDDGHMEYTLHRPVGGHSKAYVDVLYLDEDILILRGHHGTIYAMCRSIVSQRYRAIRGGDVPSNTDANE